MVSPPRPLRIAVSFLLAITSLTFVSYAQNVTTWHNDPNRTGWQQNETVLTQSNVQTTGKFGLLWQWTGVTGYVFAQPLAVTLNQTVGSCNSPCSLIFVATEQDMLYAFNASPSAQPGPGCPTCNPLVWSVDLASLVGGQASKVPCQSLTFDFAPCDTGDGLAPGPTGGIVGPYVGVTGTPVIDMTTNPNTLYVARRSIFLDRPPTSLTTCSASTLRRRSTQAPACNIS